MGVFRGTATPLRELTAEGRPQRSVIHVRFERPERSHQQVSAGLRPLSDRLNFGPGMDEESRPEDDQVRDRALTDRDQRASDHDQTASDQDQTWSDHDQTASERDQRSADEDQHAADDDFAAGGDAIIYHRSALARKRSGRDRDAVSMVRAESAAARLGTGADRDRAAELRDRGAEGRDALARLHDLQDDADASREDILLRAERDREEAARERAEARRDRTKSADSLKLATTDELTGAWTRKLGLEEVSRELERAHRTGARLVLAFVDVDGLKAVNDSQGHLAGDALLRLLGETLRANVRPYDVIVRYGGDELLCAMSNLGVPEARARFEKIAAVLAAADADHSITFGLAETGPADSLQELIARADADFLQARHSPTSNG